MAPSPEAGSNLGVTVEESGWGAWQRHPGRVTLPFFSMCAKQWVAVMAGPAPCSAGFFPLLSGNFFPSLML